MKPRQIGCLLVVLLVVALGVPLGTRFYKHYRFFSLHSHICDRIDTLGSQRPEGISPKRWDEAVGWARTAFCNTWPWDPETYVGLKAFSERFEEELAAGDSLATVRWIWDELERTTERGSLYAAAYRPL